MNNNDQIFTTNSESILLHNTVDPDIEIDGYTKYILEYEKKPLLDINIFYDNFEYFNNRYIPYPFNEPIGYNIGFLVQNKNKKHINHYFDIILKNEEIQTLDKNDIINYAFDKLKTHILKWSYENLVN